eukprot:9344190-Pyramimonas_sp.AAC.1
MYTSRTALRRTGPRATHTSQLKTCACEPDEMRTYVCCADAPQRTTLVERRCVSKKSNAWEGSKV